MTAYLDGYSPEFYKAAANVIVRRFSRTFNKAPGPAELERNMTEILMEAQRPKGEWLPEPKDVIAPGEREESLRLLEEIKKQCNPAGKGTLANALNKVLTMIFGTVYINAFRLRIVPSFWKS